MRVHVCPKCGGESVRIHRRLLDRLHGVFLPARRFRCTALQCQYECNARRTVSAKRKLALATAGLMGVTFAGVLAIDGDLPLPFASSTDVSDAHTSVVQYGADPGVSRSLVAFPAQPALFDRQHDFGAASGTN